MPTDLISKFGGAQNDVNVFFSIVPYPLSKRAVSTRELTTIWRGALINVQRRAVRRFNRTIATWEASHKARAKFVGTSTARVGDPLPYITVKQFDPVWHMLNRGTPYRLFGSTDPKNPYIPKTFPGVLDSGPGGGTIGFAGGKRFPPIQPRRWTEIVEKDVLKDFEAEVDRAMEKVEKIFFRGR